MILIKCWSGLGFGRGAVLLRLRFFSRPPLVVEYCHALIVEGREDAILAGFCVSASKTRDVTLCIADDAKDFANYYVHGASNDRGGPLFVSVFMFVSRSKKKKGLRDSSTSNVLSDPLAI